MFCSMAADEKCIVIVAQWLVIYFFCRKYTHFDDDWQL